jgi:TRAP-type mannitol/chloroaromatic compound transport system permease small subunit
VSESNTDASAQQNRRRRWYSFETVISVMNSIGTVWVFVLLVIINLDIGGRAIFNHPIRGVPEIVSMSIVACVFLQIAHTLKVGRLTRSDLLMNWLKDKYPGLKNCLEGLYYSIGAVLMAILFKASVPLFTKAWQIDEYVGAEGDFMAPIWPVKLIVLIGCLAGAIQFLLMAFDSFKQLRSSQSAPKVKASEISR